MKILGMTYRQLAAYLGTAIPGGLILDWSAPQPRPFEWTHFLVTTLGVALVQASGAIYWAWRGK